MVRFVVTTAAVSIKASRRGNKKTNSNQLFITMSIYIYLCLKLDHVRDTPYFHITTPK